MGVVLYYFADWLEIKELNKKIVKKEEDSKKTKGSVATAQNVKERERKVYDFLGQKRDPPEEVDGIWFALYGSGQESL
ncbi:uncharacterized protein LOC133690520 isoform X2 [Populus nigra]|uniref:uncharacterized protein LOC133690520 isoform X2 n=1 Tax=Populus nigra TaxID=3691 RepID=UPI002B27C084|nr:uncharacterized protein LOC133690520 isoform X2 [Populus nigra]